MSEWKPYKEIDFSDESLKQFHIDTRDFCCNVVEEDIDFEITDIDKVKKNPSWYYHTTEELIDLLHRYYVSSGGAGEWRMFTLSGEAAYRTSNWQMKYIRIYRMEQGFLIILKEPMEKYTFVMPKRLLSCPVNQELLNFH